MQIRLSMLLTLGLLSGLTPFAIDLYLPSLPAIARDLDSTIEIAQLSVTLYLGVFALAQLVLGPASDVLGRRATIGSGLLLFALGALICALAPTMEVLLAGRAVQGLGGAAIAVTVPALVRDLFERDRYAQTMSLVMLTTAMAPLVAPSVGGLILVWVGWHGIFMALLILALLAGGLFLILVPETLGIEQRHAPELGRVLRNYRTILRDRSGLGYLLAGAFSFGGMMSYIVASAFVYIDLHGVEEVWFGVYFGANVAVAMLVTMQNARLVLRFGAERLLRMGLGVQMIAALLLLGLGLWGVPPLWAIIGATLLYLSMAGVVLGNAMAGFMASFARMAGTASAFSGASRFGLGAVMGSLISLFHTGTAAPLLFGMAFCGLAAGLSYWLLCCSAPNPLGVRSGRAQDDPAPSSDR
ncbi:Bcr/CflA family drug resistance efflux transporter [Thiocapsa imhoffii]|uniref:Bcr/CflA family efflux transporter n=1 Tax=Thiocapsa imhoffii TaxID=382777 RepID=A0A9X0WHV1_9GAMM|nr:Bcr/CflA family multidrug efflux MFS transporter [Thiocapsa imhoffii]MBK1644820.1 Bcr/CflA family drug resistance efflux transporter [Thiocapsa imhoffii]